MAKEIAWADVNKLVLLEHDDRSGGAVNDVAGVLMSDVRVHTSYMGESLRGLGDSHGAVYC